MTQTKKNPQAGNLGEPNVNLSFAAKDNSIVAETPHGIEAVAYVSGVYVAVVEIRGDHVPPRYRRRTFWNLPSAQRAIDRAHMAGKEARIVLCKLVPMGGDPV